MKLILANNLRIFHQISCGISVELKGQKIFKMFCAKTETSINLAAGYMNKKQMNQIIHSYYFVIFSSMFI